MHSKQTDIFKLLIYNTDPKAHDEFILRKKKIYNNVQNVIIITLHDSF